MSDTKFRLIDVGVSIVWLACVGISVLKGKLWSAALGVLSAVAVMAGWTVGGWYIFNPLTYVPVFAAIRLGRPDFYWARWFYRKNPRKFSRAILKYGMAEDYLEAQRRARDAFTTARSRYEESQREISSYTTLARDRAAIMRARIRYDQTKDSQAYEEEVAAFTDPAVFVPYTETRFGRLHY